jgi:hypothetical protein
MLVIATESFNEASHPSPSGLNQAQLAFINGSETSPLLWYRVASFVGAQWHRGRKLAQLTSDLQDYNADIFLDSPPFVIDFLSTSTFLNTFQLLSPSISTHNDGLIIAGDGLQKRSETDCDNSGWRFRRRFQDCRCSH